MSKIINLRLLARPGNWVKVFLMLFIFAMLMHFIQRGKSASNGPTPGLVSQPN